MTIYKITHDSHIEATSAEQAEELLIENNGASKEEYFTDHDAAAARFAAVAASLQQPHDLGFSGKKHLYWFDGVMLEAGRDCDEPEDGDTLRGAFNSAADWEILSLSIGEEA